tara:strand:- start:658 stop:942 length:285 start_codon:yes stop_codon:yes gene_type:complete
VFNMIIDKITVTTAKQIPNEDTSFMHDVRTAITVRELYAVVKKKALAIAEDLELQTQGKARVSVEMVEGAGGLPCADIWSYGSITNQVFCTDEV